jgi:hypothetical protein
LNILWNITPSAEYRFINVAVAEKVSPMEVASYFRERAKRANIPEALASLDRLGTEPPRPGDELKPGGADEIGCIAAMRASRRTFGCSSA